MFCEKKILKLLNIFFKNDLKFNIYRKSIFKIFEFSKNNFNSVTYNNLFFILKKIDINDINKIVFIIKKLNIKIFKIFPYEYLLKKEDVKDNKNNFYYKKKDFDNFYYNKTKYYKGLSNQNIINKYKKIEIYLKNISETLSGNLFLVNDIFSIKNEFRRKNLIYKIKDLKSNLSEKKYFYFKNINKNFENIIDFDDKDFSKNPFSKVNENFILLNFLIKNIDCKKTKVKKKLLINFIKNKYIKFKINLDMIDYLYNIILDKINILNNLRDNIYDNLSNISNFSYLKFNFYFLKNGSDLKWTLKFLDLKDDYIKKIYIKSIKKNSKRIKIIELKYKTSIKYIFKIFDTIKENKAKIDIIRNKIIKSKFDIINRTSRKYRLDDAYEECQQEGCLSLIKSINIYNYKTSNDFEIFATYNMRRAMSRYFYRNNRLIKLPSYMFSIIRKINSVRKEYKMKFGTDPEIEYISNVLNIKKNKIRSVLNHYKQPSSINKITDDNDTELLEFINDEKNINPDNTLFDSELKEYIEEIMKTIDERSANILSMRYGLNFSRRYTLAEVGGIYNLSKERVRQIQNSALKKIKIEHDGDRLNNFFNSKNKYYYFKN